MDTMRVEFQSWFDDDDSDYIYTWVDIDTGETFSDLDDARDYAEENGLILEVIE